MDKKCYLIAIKTTRATDMQAPAAAGHDERFPPRDNIASDP
jgi:hypothetical protein